MMRNHQLQELRVGDGAADNLTQRHRGSNSQARGRTPTPKRPRTCLGHSFARLIETRSEQRGATLVLTTDGLRVGRRQFMFEKRLTKYISCHIQGRQARREC